MTFKPRRKKTCPGFLIRSDTNRAVQPQNLLGSCSVTLFSHIQKSQFSHDATHITVSIFNHSSMGPNIN